MPRSFPLSSQHSSTCPRVFLQARQLLSGEPSHVRGRLEMEGALIPRKTASQPMMDVSWQTSTPASLLRLPCLLGPQQDRAPVVLSVSMLHNTPFQLPSLPVLLPCRLPVLPGSTSKMSYLLSYLCLRACFSENPTQDGHHIRQWLYISIASDRNPNLNWLKQKGNLLAHVIEQSRLIALASGTIESLSLNDVTST